MGDSCIGGAACGGRGPLPKLPFLKNALDEEAVMATEATELFIAFPGGAMIEDTTWFVVAAGGSAE
jgi:hypothetical protein